MEDSEAQRCRFCDNTEAMGKYTCPRCNRRYCSTECYRSEAHAACSESFYRDCFMEGLRDLQQTDGEERHRIAEMLRRLESDAPPLGEDDDGESGDLADRMLGIDLDRCPDSEVWSRLTAAERRDFERVLDDGGRVADLVPLWTPWWIPGAPSLVEEINDDVRRNSLDAVLPSALTRLPDITAVTRTARISDLVPHSVVNIVYGYAYSARLFNGDHAQMAAECAQIVSDISESTGPGGVFPDAAMAIAGCIAQLDGGAARAHFVSREYSCAVVDDVCRIIAGKSADDPTEFVIAALSDIHRVFEKARQEVGKAEELRRKYRARMKKIEFMVSWAKKFGSVLQIVLPTLEMESCKLSTEIAAYRSKQLQVEQALVTAKLQKQKMTGPLITEIC